ncbi:MAG: LUD domain-containing protein [Deltaproteobacteria bacterium]|nr:LUD domain-containing protein [Deltaproteobacteria bacterium]
MRDGLTKVLAGVRSALERKPHVSVDHLTASPNLPVTPSGRRTELISQFAHELERVNGHFMGVMSLHDVYRKLESLTDEIRPRSVAIGEAVALDFGPIMKTLERSGIEVVRCSGGNDQQLRILRERLANCDLTVVEAHYAIAATGTLVVVATPQRPSSLTLLPPANFLVVEAKRIVPDMAAVINALGAGIIVKHRVAFITGPSRTADIEKRIVLGVHGPKDVYAAAVWSGEQDGSYS